MRLFPLFILMMTFIVSSAQAQDFDASTTYSEFCTACHGFDGTGMSAETPDFTSKETELSNQDDKLIEVIMKGVEQADGTILMPPFGGADPFTKEQSQQLIQFLQDSFGS